MRISLGKVEGHVLKDGGYRFTAENGTLDVIPVANGIVLFEYNVSRTGDTENLVWNISGANITLDSQKAADWLNSFNTLTTNQWHGTSDDLGGEPYAAVQLGTTKGTITIETYIVPADPDVEGSTNLYYGKCNKSPYWFEIASYNFSKFQKKPEDLEK